MPDTAPGPAALDLDQFRLRRFVETLIQAGECEVVSEPVALTEIARRLDGNPKAVLFRAAGPERAHLVGNVMGARARLSRAIGVEARGLTPEIVRRLQKPIPPVEIASADAPVHQVVRTGNAPTFTALPVHLQHGQDGAPYISAALDFARDPDTGFTNVGIRRFMLRGRTTAGLDLNAPSDLRAIYQKAHSKGEKLPIAVAIGSHPADYLAALALVPPMDEVALMGALRGAPVPLVKGVTVDIHYPADAEYVLEGYIDAAGWSEPEGPYGEYVGYYGRLKTNPVFHLTAICRRKDALFQTATIGGRTLGYTDTAQLSAVKTEPAVWTALQGAVREIVDVHATPSSGGMYNVRIAIRQRVPGEARNAIAAVFGSFADVKHVFVVDDDIDVFSHDQIDWALATRFQADRDLVVAKGFRAVPLDPSLGGARVGAKAGFDLTLPFGTRAALEHTVPEPPSFGTPGNQSVADALADGAKTFRDLIEATGSTDGREILVALETLREAGRLTRLADGRYGLTEKPAIRA